MSMMAMLGMQQEQAMESMFVNGEIAKLKQEETAKASIDGNKVSSAEATGKLAKDGNSAVSTVI